MSNANHELVEINASESAMTRWVTQKLIDRVTSNTTSDATREMLRQEIRDHAIAFAGPNPSEIERVLAETAALALFALRTNEVHFAQAQSSDELSFAQARYYLRKIEHAQRRLESAIRTLASVRRFALPSVQINIAQK